MNAQQLRNSILQEAIEGRLVPQDPNDEPASVLLERIREEKRRLVKEGKLKKKDLEETPISEDEKPFEIPNSWEWVRLQDITIYISRGKSPVYTEIRKYPVVAQKCNQWSGFSLEKAKFADPKTIDKYTEERLLLNGDLLWNSTGLGTLGRMAIYDSRVNEYGWAVADSHVTVIRTLSEFCIYKYLFYYFTSPEVQTVIEDKSDGSTKQKELAQVTVKNYEVPLPPLAEQKRIVAKIEELLPKVEEYGKAQNALDKLNKELPEKLKKSILQEAITGRLVPQDPNDEPASALLDKIRKEKEQLVKEGKLKKKDLEEKPISEDEIPFEIPESWEWVRLNTLSKVIHYGYTASASINGNSKLLRITDIQDDKVNWSTVPFCTIKTKDLETYQLNNRDILIARTGVTVGKTYIVRELKEVSVFASYLIRVIPLENAYEEYVKLFMSSPFYWSQLTDATTGTGQPNVNGQSLSKLVIPLPPLAEQKRIVAKIEELFAEIDKLKA